MKSFSLSLLFMSFLTMFMCSCETTEREFSVYNKTVTISATDSDPFLDEIPVGSELVYYKLSIKNSQDDRESVIKEIGTINNHIYQRTARPWTHLDSTEQWVYNEDAEVSETEEGQVVNRYRITRVPNIQSVTQKITSDTPVITDILSMALSDAKSGDMLNISFKLRGFPNFDIPLKPRLEADTSEKDQVEQERQKAKESRQLLAMQLSSQSRDLIEEAGGVVHSVSWITGWVHATVLVETIDALMSRTDLKIITTSSIGNDNNGCVDNLLCNSENSNPNILYLGHTGKYEIMNYNKFHDIGFNGLISNSSRQNFGRLTVAVVESSVMEDEARYLYDAYSPIVSDIKVKGTYLCNSSSCSNVDFSDYDTDDGHGDCVASTIVSDTSHGQASGQRVADACWDGSGDHCDDFLEVANGVAPRAGLIYYAASFDGASNLAYEDAIDQSVDVMNISMGSQDTSRQCKMTTSTAYEEALQAAFDDGVFVVNSSGNGGVIGSCNVNGRSTKPKVFSVGSVLSYIDLYTNSSPPYPFVDRTYAWTAHYNNYQSFLNLHPATPTSYNQFQIDPKGAARGGADVIVNGYTYSGQATVIDLVAPGSGFRTWNNKGSYGESNAYFQQSSGAAARVSGAALLVKHWLLNEGQAWVNSPGRLHTVMLGMGDRHYWSDYYGSFKQRPIGSHVYWGNGRIKLRLLKANQGLSPVNYTIQTRTWSNSSSFPYYARLYTNPISTGAHISKCVFMQDENMGNENDGDLNWVSKFTVTMQIRTPYNNTCPETPNDAYQSIVNSASQSTYDIKKSIAILDNYYGQTYPNIEGNCGYLKIEKTHIPPKGITVHWFCYYAGIKDDVGVQ